MSGTPSQTHELVVLLKFDYEHFVPGVIAIFQWSDGTETRQWFLSRKDAFEFLLEIQRGGNIKPANLVT
jgi:hypothetical protein